MQVGTGKSILTGIAIGKLKLFHNHFLLTYPSTERASRAAPSAIKALIYCGMLLLLL